MFIRKFSARNLLFFCFFFISSSCNDDSIIDQASLISFENINFINQNNQYLICPLDHCYGATPDRKGPIYNLSVFSLKKIFKEIIIEQPRVKFIIEKFFLVLRGSNE